VNECDRELKPRGGPPDTETLEGRDDPIDLQARTEDATAPKQNLAAKPLDDLLLEVSDG
jgi:hypothetical protein